MSHMPDDPKVEPRVLKELANIVGEKYATAKKHIRYAYSYDLTFVERKSPEYVVLPQCTEHVDRKSVV